eukprot:XP_016656346.1 PREDICTED: zinc finger protein 681-like [Acyrthosiphon pisum]
MATMKKKLGRNFNMATKKKRFKIIDIFLKYIKKGDKVLNIKMFKCKTCFKHFKMKHHLIRHERIHSGEKPFSCDICNTSYRDLSNLKSHILCHSNERPYSCITEEKCDKKKIRFKRKSHFYRHLKAHTDMCGYSCNMCQKRYTTNSNVNRHKKQVHNILPKYI